MNPPNLQGKLETTPVSNGSGRSEQIHADEASFRLVAAIPPQKEIQDFELFSISFSNKTTQLTHGLHRFPAKYIPEIPRWAISEFSDSEISVLDPFMGSGTTLVESRLHTGVARGLDVDPLSCLIARAKTSNVNPAQVAQLGQKILQKWTRPATRLTVPMSGVKNFSHWFGCETWGWLQSLHDLILEIECDDDQRRFLLVVFSSILRRVSNADDQTQKTYVSGTLKKNPPEVQTTFWRAFERALLGLRDMDKVSSPNSQISIQQGSASALPFDSHEFDLIVTSPPYLDSVDYMYNAMLEYFWLGPELGVNSREEFNSMRRATIGAKNPHVKPTQFPDYLSDLVDVSEIAAARLPATIDYCMRMQTHFEEAARVLRPGGHYVLVIGNSQSARGILPVHDALLRMASNTGFQLKKAFAYRIRRHYMKFPRKGRGGIILVDWVLVLERTSQRMLLPERLPLPWLKLGNDEVAN